PFAWFPPPLSKSVLSGPIQCGEPCRPNHVYASNRTGRRIDNQSKQTDPLMAGCSFVIGVFRPHSLNQIVQPWRLPTVIASAMAFAVNIRCESSGEILVVRGRSCLPRGAGDNEHHC